MERLERGAAAREFFASAEEDFSNRRYRVAVSNYILAGIACSDVICFDNAGWFASGDSHGDAIRLLKTVDPQAASSLGRLLRNKTAFQYGAVQVGQTSAAEAMKSCIKLLKRARLR